MPAETDTSPWRLDWTAELGVFIPEIDAEHQHFVQLINELNEAIIDRLDAEEIKKRMQAIQYLRQLMEDFERAGTECAWVEAGLKVKQVLIEHLLTEDMKYRDFHRAMQARIYPPGTGEHPPVA